MSLQAIMEDLLGPDSNVRFRVYDGSEWGPSTAPTTVVIKHPDALKYLARAPGELGFGRAYVSGAVDFEGEIWPLLDLQGDIPDLRLEPHHVRELIRMIGLEPWSKPPPIPPEEIRIGSKLTRHTRQRDKASISHHYDVSNDFYRLVLGPSMTYSCAVFENESDSLEQAQGNKYELISRKLGLRAGQRLLDVGCGWGGMVLHAARHHEVEAVGITISDAQAERARERVAEAGLSDRIEIRVQDYRELGTERFDAISSIGMFEHVGLAHLRDYFTILFGLLENHGRLLNHQIGRTPGPHRRFRREETGVNRRGFMHRYVFPDGELHEVGNVTGAMQRTGFEVRHLESLREHYALTLRHWVKNLEDNWDECASLTSEGRARVWRLYMAASSMMFATGEIQVHQVLGVKTPKAGSGRGRSGMGFRPRWNQDLSRMSRRPSNSFQPALMDLRDLPAYPVDPEHDYTTAD